MPSVMAFLEALQASPWGLFIHRKAFAFTTVEVVHVFAVSLLLGTIMIVDLRLTGVTRARRPFTELARQVLPFTWAAFVLAAVTGFLLFSSRATSYVASPVFWTKMALIGLAGINMAIFELRTVREVAKCDPEKPPPAARLAGAVSIACWLLVICSGRLIAFALLDE